MMSGRIRPITMPKWGLSMDEGTVNRWLVSEGDTVQPGMAVVEVASDKIAGSLEFPTPGILRRRVAGEEESSTRRRSVRGGCRSGCLRRRNRFLRGRISKPFCAWRE
jgi:hypothetical protein